MEIFEIHITAEEKIIQEAKKLNLKTIIVDLLKPDRSCLRTEYMTSHVYSCESLQSCKNYVEDICKKLVESGVNLFRVKIECPYNNKYTNESFYIESHFNTNDTSFPLSRNKGKSYCLGTEREYNKDNYQSFRDKYANSHLDDFVLELCVHDTNVNEDKDWFDLYKRS